MTERKRVVAVIGGSDCTAEEARIAEEVGRELAKRGATVICGGMSGVMTAACKGAFSAGGLTIGVLPGDDRESANQYVQIPIVTSIGYARNIIVVKSAQAVIAVGGSYGTLCEISYALQSHLPVIGLDTWSISRDGHTDKSIIRVKTPAEAVNKAFELIEANED